MNKQLHIHILDALRQAGAIGQMVDIKPAFLDELDTQEKRKNFKAQLDYLVSEGLIETPSKYEFLGWELLNGLYNIDNKKIEGRLVGRWESFLSSRGNIKREPVNFVPPPPPEPETPKIKKLGLYDAPPSVLPYPGVNVTKPETPKAEEEEETIFTSKRSAPAPVTNPDADVFLKEDDFLPFKTRAQSKKQSPPPAPSKPLEDPYSAKISNYTAPKEPEPVKEEPLPPLPVEPAKEEPKAVDDVPGFSASKVAYTPPKTESKDTAITVKPFTPTPPAPQAWEVEDKPAAPTRISATVKRKVTEEEEEVPIITARTAGLRAKAAPVADYVPPITPDVPVKETPANSSRVVNLSSGASSQSIKTVEPMIPLRSSPAAAPQPAPQPTAHNPLANSHSIPPPPSNFAAMRFDTDNNPFAGLGTINLAADEEVKPKKKPIWTILKWAVIIFVILVVIVVGILYKMRYG